MNKSLIPFDENNVPQIDRAITPPPLPSRFEVPARTAYPERPPCLNMFRLASFKKKRLNLTCGRSGSHRSRSSTSATEELPKRSSSMTVGKNGSLQFKKKVLAEVHSCKDEQGQRLIFHDSDTAGWDDVSLYETPKEDFPNQQHQPQQQQQQQPQPTSGDLTHSRSANFSSTSYLRDQIVALFQPSDNKLALKLFGNRNALMKEKMRQKAVSSWVIHPCSDFRYASYT